MQQIANRKIKFKNLNFKIEEIISALIERSTFSPMSEIVNRKSKLVN